MTLPTKTTTLSLLKGLRPGPSQVFGGVRMLPLLRDLIRDDVRLFRQPLSTVGVIPTDNKPIQDSKSIYCSFVPHALVLAANAQEVEVSRGLQILEGKKQHQSVTVFHRMAKREAGGLRFLPQHLAFEGYISQHFDAPDYLWPEYTKAAARRGLQSRSETVWPGHAVCGLQDALRMFEIHDGQVGVAVFVCDALAEIFVVPHPNDYRALHKTLVEDAYADLIVQYSRYALASEVPFVMDESRVSDTATLRASFAAAKGAMLSSEQVLLQHLPATLPAEKIRDHRGLTMMRVMPHIDLDLENHIGEALTYADGDVAYLKTYRLSGAQAKRAFVLQALAKNNFHLRRTAESLQQSIRDFADRLDAAGFSYLFKPDVWAMAKAGTYVGA
jgi:hypothetical protein